MKTPQLHPLLIRIMPFLAIAFAIIIFVLTLFVFSYVFIFAIVVGLILFAIKFIRTKFFGHKNGFPNEPFFVIKTHIHGAHHPEHSGTKKPASSSEKNAGRIIEHDEEKK